MDERISKSMLKEKLVAAGIEESQHQAIITVLCNSDKTSSRNLVKKQSLQTKKQDSQSYQGACLVVNNSSEEQSLSRGYTNSNANMSKISKIQMHINLF